MLQSKAPASNIIFISRALSGLPLGPIILISNATQSFVLDKCHLLRKETVVIMVSPELGG